MDHEGAERDSTWMQLWTCTVIHYNYSWLTHAPTDALVAGKPHKHRTLGIGGELKAKGSIPLFLDDELKASVVRGLDEKGISRDRYELRLAGLLHDDSSETTRAHLGLVYIARLRRPGLEGCEHVLSSIRFCGTGELQSACDQFDAWSRILIDHLLAF